MAIYAKITIKRKNTDIEKSYIALLNSGAQLKPISVDIDFIPLPTIIVPPEVAQELQVDLGDFVGKEKKYLIDGKNLYKVCLYDPDDNPVVCLDDVLLVIEKDLDRILITYEFMSIAQIDLKPSIHSWVHEGKIVKNIFMAKKISEIERKLLRYTPYGGV